MSEVQKRPTERTSLAVIPAAMLPTIIAADETDILGRLAEKVKVFFPDISTEVGRGEIRSLAYEIAKNKTALDNIGKGLTDGWRKSTAAVNAERALLRERLEELQEKVRAPLTEWENAEKDRVAFHEKAIAEIASWPHIPTDWSASQIAERIAELDGSPLLNRDWQEFKARAVEAVRVSATALKRLHVEVETREAEASELARLRAEAAERARQDAARQQAEREAQIAADAAAKAKAEAERRAAEEAAEAERRAAAEREQIMAEARARENAAEAERQRVAREVEEKQIAAERAAKAERDAAIQREQEAAEALAKAEREKLAAQEAARRAVDKAEADRVAAVEAERQRAAAERAAAEREAERRAANIAHRKRINGEALTAMILAMREAHSGTAEEADAIGKSIIAAIAKREIPHVSMEY